MSSRQIIDCGATIKKVVPPFPELENKKFPYPLEPDGNIQEQIYNLLKDMPKLAQSAITQQYNEYYIFRYTENKEAIAPIQYFSRDERGLPILEFPKFIPLASDKTFYRFTDEESLIEFGRIAGKLNVDFKEIKDFIEKVKNLCYEFDLYIDDMMYNLSNMGYNKDYGFRIIDYGLCYNSGKYELVI